MSVEELQKRIQELEAALAAAKCEKEDAGPVRDKISNMSSEVVDSNPYSRLMALKRMGIVDNYEKIREYTVALVGVGMFSNRKFWDYFKFVDSTELSSFCKLK